MQLEAGIWEKKFEKEGGKMAAFGKVAGSHPARCKKDISDLQDKVNDNVQLTWETKVEIGRAEK